MPDDREPLGRLAYEAQAAWQQEQPAEMYWCSRAWAALSDEEREPFMRAGSAVAAQAVADAGLEDARKAAQLFAIAVHLPAVRRALRKAAAGAEYEAQAKPYRAALTALGDSEEEAPHG